MVMRPVFGLRMVAETRTSLISNPFAPALPRMAPPNVPGMPVRGARFRYLAFLIRAWREIPASAVMVVFVRVALFAVRRMTAPLNPLSWKRMFVPPPIMMKGTLFILRSFRRDLRRVSSMELSSMNASAGPPIRNVQ